MSIWAIVPAKPFKQAKSRLATALSLAEREALSRSFLAHTLDVLAQVRDIERTLVVSRDPAVLQAARAKGAYTVTESGSPELNPALTRATGVATSFGAHAVLVLPTDLPLLIPSDIQMLITASSEPECVTIAPDRREDGTNALFLSPPNIIPFAFGARSFRRHLSLARAGGLCTEVCRFPNVALDVDLPEDLELYSRIVGQPSSPVVG